MTKHLPGDLLDPNSRHSGTPADLVIRTEARKPATKATLDVDVPSVAPGSSKHRLVTLGDSLSMGFQSLGTANTAICWPRIVAWELGLDDKDFVTPTLSRYGGMPLNLEFLLRELEPHVGDLRSVPDMLRAAFFGVGFGHEVARFWGTEWDRNISPKPVHNLASWGWDIADLQQVTASFLRQEVETSPFYPSSAAARSAYRVLSSARRRGESEGTLTPVEAAHAFGEDGGIETLVVMIGANNALRSVIDLEVTWTDDSGAHRDPHGKQRFTVWHPKHFREQLDRLVDGLANIQTEHVILSTVPHVTVPPVTRGVTPGAPGSKVTANSRYFEFYTRPWAEAFDYRDDPCLTAGQARAIDSAIDDYNDAIENAVRQKRSEGRRWFLLETAGLLDRLASRRYLEHPAARPSWWDSVGGAYPLPEPLARLGVDSRFFLADANGRTQGGLFSLDGVHPTTIGYGLIAQEVMNVMHLAGVKFRLGNGAIRPGPVAVDFDRLLRLDTLMAAPPRLTAGLLTLLRTLDERSEGVLQRLGVAL
jgi:hypothetical protein